MSKTYMKVEDVDPETGLRSFIVDESIPENCNVTKPRIATKIHLDPRNSPIMTAEVAEEVEIALVQYESRAQWKDWGLNTLRKQGACVSLAGPAGCGKTSIAHYMSKRVGRGVVTLNMKDVSGKAPGEIERNIAEVFRKAQSEGNKTIILDECEAILIDRSKAGNDSLWIISVVDEVLMQVARYPGLVILASNHPSLLDQALLDRCFASLQIGMPGEAERVKLWKQKIPARYPLQPTEVQFQSLATITLNGRNIEAAIMREASAAIRHKRKPSLKSLLEQATILANKK